MSMNLKQQRTTVMALRYLLLSASTPSRSMERDRRGMAMSLALAKNTLTAREGSRWRI